MEDSSSLRRPRTSPDTCIAARYASACTHPSVCSLLLHRVRNPAGNGCPARWPHHPTQPNMLGRQSSRSSTATSPWSPDDETIRDLPSTQPTHARGSLSRRGLGAGPAGSLLRPIASAPPDGEASVVLDRRPVPVPASTCPWIITY